MTMIKGKSNTSASGSSSDAPTFKENPQVNAKIDDYITANPKHWDYIQSMSKERMSRALVLHEVQKQERVQKMKEGIFRKLEQDPAMKASIESIVNKLPEAQRERATISIARSTLRATAPRQAQSSGVKV